MDRAMALAIVYLVVGILMHMIAFSKAQEDIEFAQEDIEFSCTFDDNLLSADADHSGTVDPSEAFRWKDGKIPYFFRRVTSRDKQVFYAAMKQIEGQTCFKFEERGNEPREHHLDISVGSPSCTARGFSAGVGVASFRKVTLQSSYQLADSSRCNWQGGILHELMHVLGVMHTQKRKDRNDHIIINRNNIQGGRGAAYQYSTCQGCNDFGVGYDCASIMHYGTNTFGNGRGPTMRARNPRSCKLSGAGAAFDGRGAAQSDWDLLKKVANTVCTGSVTPPPRPVPVTPVNPFTPVTPVNPVTPPPRPVPDSDCRTVAGPSAGSPCVFPFKFAGTTYDKCTFYYSDDGLPWCSTKTDRRGNHIGGHGYWGTCGKSCRAEKYDYYSDYNGLEFSDSITL